jgi:hypothetical protein
MVEKASPRRLFVILARKRMVFAAQLDDNDIDIRTVADLDDERPVDQPPPSWALPW